MTNEIHNYLIDPSRIDWSEALANWSWLLPAESTVWLVSRFADLFVVFPAGTIHMLDVGAGSLDKVADSKDDFREKADDAEYANSWFMIPQADRMILAGVNLDEGQCYGWKLSPVLGGQYTVENCAPLPLADYLGAYGSLHRQLQHVPDGAQVILKTTPPPK